MLIGIIPAVDVIRFIADPVVMTTGLLTAQSMDIEVSMFKKVIIAVVVLILVLLVVGYLLPRSYSVSRSSFINAEASKVHASVVDLRSWPEWTPWNQEMDPTLKYEYSGPDSQVGSISSWTGEKSGPGSLEITSAEEGRGIVYILTFEGNPPADGVVQITPMKGGCEVFWKMSGETEPPLGPYFQLLFDALLGADFEACLAGLKERCE